MQLRNILLVDDQEIPAQESIRSLEHFVPRECIHYVSSAAEAMDYLRERGADLVFLDIDMPGTSGFSLAEYMTIEAALDSTNMFNAKSKAEEVKKLLARYIPAVEDMATQLRKYGVAFEEVEDLQAENEQLTRELDAAKRGSITEKLEQAKIQREYKQAKAILDRIPPDILNQLRKESRAVQRDTPEDLRH